MIKKEGLSKKGKRESLNEGFHIDFLFDDFVCKEANFS
jgi:hypothetical protein